MSASYAQVQDEEEVDREERVLAYKRSRRRFLAQPGLVTKLLVEFFGTMAFVFFGAGTANHPDVELIAVSAAHGLVTLWLVYVFGEISGGHFNAAVTIVMFIEQKMKVLHALLYLVVQAVGCVCGGLLLWWLYGGGTTLGTPQLSEGVMDYQGLGIEFVCTFFLINVVLFSTSYHSHKEAAFPIGFAVFTSFLVGAPLDGAALNPWRWLGPAVVSQTFDSYLWIYLVGPVAGMLFGYLFFLLVRSLFAR